LAAVTRLATAANQHGVETAKCGDCKESVDISLLTEPRCPHCQATFSSLEPKRGLFRSSILKTGTVPALEAAEAPDDSEIELAAIAESDAGQPDDGGGPATAPESRARGDPTPGDDPASSDGEPESTDATSGGDAAADGLSVADEAPTTDEEPDRDAGAPSSERETRQEAPADTKGATGEDGAKENGLENLQSIYGIGPKYAKRLQSVGITSMPALAVADPDQLADSIGVHAWTVAEWVEEAAAHVEGT
ncbi:MAG: helix-hairpin-helix domain-containing protein, partial [Acidimicrobiia bacterium]|nr:helix-hairpin-helix domain-containing protein [Acidimicrobiia bacterium]